MCRIHNFYISLILICKINSVFFGENVHSRITFKSTVWYYSSSLSVSTHSYLTFRIIDFEKLQFETLCFILASFTQNPCLIYIYL